MAEAALRRATYEDIRSAPPHAIAEIVNGELHVQPRPGGPHARAASGLGMDLGAPFDRGRGGPGGWVILYEPELHLGDDVLVPDLAGWRTERMPQQNAAYYEVAPDWVCEVLSLSTARHDRGPKADCYASAGVGYLWFVDPNARFVEAFVRVEDGRVIRWTRLGAWSEDGAARIPPFDAVGLDLSLLWVTTPEPELCP